MVLFALSDMLDLAHLNPLVFTSKQWYKQVIVKAANVKVGGGAGGYQRVVPPQFIFSGSC